MGDSINPDCEILRYASGGQLQDDVLSGGAFKPRSVDDGKLSVNRLGVFAKDFEQDLSLIRVVVSKWMTIRKTGRFAQLTAASIGEILKDAESAFKLEESKLEEKEGKPEDPSHALVHGIPSGEDDGAIATRDMIALKVSALHEALT